eukprot:TRINITY_DN10685_c0_g1_i3.p1 TRINITY_DN10685_c0_g1~~TRINITY_DN10685_c0_g1_i3.p1  ORF type:complete len:620 (+),score=182.26 TRINITY_DN10685_c0_g1_i3:47-1906(+)
MTQEVSVDERQARGEDRDKKGIMQRTKSSVRRAREFKQFGEVDLLDVDAGDGFDLLQHPKKEGKDKDSGKEVLADSTMTNAPSATLTFKKPLSTISGAQRSHTKEKVLAGASKASTTTFSSARRTATTSSTFQRTATDRTSNKTRHADPIVASSKKIGEMKEELMKLKHSLTEAQDSHQEKEQKWKMEREGLVSGMRSGGREMERVSGELTSAQTELKEALAETEVHKKESETAIQKLQEAQTALAESENREREVKAANAAREHELKAVNAAREHELKAVNAALEEKIAVLTKAKQTAVEQEHLAVARVQCMVGSHQELARRAELERTTHQTETRALEAVVNKLTSSVEKLTLNLKKEQGTTQTARRSLEAVEAVNKRLEAEKVRLEGTVQSQELTLERSLSTPVASPGPLFKPRAGSDTEELWAVINDMEAAKKDAEEKHQEELGKHTAENEEMWAECERLSSEVETLKLELIEAAASVVSANEKIKSLDKENEEVPVSEETPMKEERRIDSPQNVFEYTEPAPLKSSSLAGKQTRFGFVPMKVLCNPETPTSSRTATPSPTLPARPSIADRRRDLQQARNARKAEAGPTLARQQSTVFDSIMDEMGAMKKNTPMSPR